MLLAIDTSTRLVGVALYDGVQVVSEMVWLSQQYHTVELAPTVSAVMERAGISMRDLEVLTVALGPGSFTGLRIGLSLVKGMALAGHLAIVGVPSLDILAASQPPSDLPLVAILRAGRGRLAASWYKYQARRWQSDRQVKILTAPELAASIKTPTLVCGELNEEERPLFKRKRKNVLLATPAQSLRRPSFLAEIGWRRWKKGLVDDPASLSPFYLQHGQANPG
jgi:tRNA threonylcarbamoyladenosine biosynthesis protein TsaB